MRIIIHVGPGKTGSSALQKCLLENQLLLSSKGIYYPSHTVDENGIGAGNLLSVFTYSSNGELEFDEQKAKQLQQKCEEKGYLTLLLSSEAFISRFEALSAFFDNAEYVYYLRNPVNSEESLYNQSVKRHFNTSKISLTKTSGFERLIRLFDIAKGRVHIRKYGSAFFVKNDIVVDFMSIVLPELELTQESAVVNASYSLVAMELKRSFNYFPSKDLHMSLDVFLQKHSKSKKKFSLLRSAQYKQLQKHSIENLESLSKALKIDLTDFIEDIKSNKQAKYCEQELCKKEALVLFEKMAEYEPNLFSVINKILTLELIPEPIAKPIRQAIVNIDLNQNSKIVFTASQFLSKAIGQSNASKMPLRGINSFIDNITVQRDEIKSQVFRDLSILFTKNEMDEAAFRFMAEAKLCRPHGKFINRDLKKLANELYRIIG